MSEFNGRKYFGFSLHKDPALSTTVRNFEFRYARPEHLERALQKVQLTDNANDKQKKTVLLNKYCKMGKPEKDSLAGYQNRDTDVETHMSFAGGIRSRVLSDTEIDQLVGKATSTMALLELNKNKENENISEAVVEVNGNDQPRCTSEGPNPNSLPPVMENFEEPLDLHELDELPELFNLSDTEFKDTPTDKDSETYEVIEEEYRNPKPKWVEIVEGPANATMSVELVKQPSPLPETTKSTPVLSAKAQALAQFEFPQMPPYAANMMLPDMPNFYGDGQEYFAEDSDLEYEMLGRANYSKYCGPRPKQDELNNTSQDDECVPRFVQIEPKIPTMNLSFLKNTTPMRYTEVTEDAMDERLEKQILCNYNSQLQAYLNSAKITGKKKDDSKPKNTGATKKKITKPKTPLPSTTVSKRSISPRSKYSKFSDSPRSGSGASNQRSKVHSPRQPYPLRETPTNTSRLNTARQRKNSATKTLEELKLEKVAIFSKMSTSQERIIELLDKLKLNLLEINVPENSFEKTKRQKNAFEFSVRFSRNFLYPLKGMIEDLKNTSEEQLNSAISNDACTRLSNTYSLLHQAVEKYQKQLRYFLLDQVPQKLNVLIELIYTVNSLCLQKGILDRNDQITDCLQDRCVKFLEFLENMHEERFMTARENFRRLNYQKRTQSNYDLKMFMNDLNMYEPKLVPKESGRNKRANRRKVNVKKIVHNAAENSSSLVVNKNEDEIATQIQGMTSISQMDTMPSIPTLVPTSCEEVPTDKSDCAQNLNKALAEALQTVTKEQVRQVLKPILETIGTALDKNRNSEVIETILNVFNNLAENKRRSDSKRLKKKNKVAVEKVDKCESASKMSMQCASTTANVAKQTKTLPPRKAHETNKMNRFAADDDSQNGKLNNNNNNNTDVAIQSSAIVINSSSSSSNIKKRQVNVNSRNEATAAIDKNKPANPVETFYEHYKAKKRETKVRDADESSSSESEFSDSSSPPDTDVEQLGSFKVTLVNTKSNWSHQTGGVAKSQGVQQGAQVPTARSRKARHQQISEKKHTSSVKLQTLSGKAQDASGKARIERKIVQKSSSSLTANKDAGGRTHTHRSTLPSSRATDKKVHFKKRRNPLLPPPPVPTVTPNSSARSGGDDGTKSTHSKMSSKRVNSAISNLVAGEGLPHEIIKQQQYEVMTTKVELQRNDDNLNAIKVPLTHTFEKHTEMGVLNLMQNHCIADILTKCRNQEIGNGEDPHDANANSLKNVLYTNSSPYQRKHQDESKLHEEPMPDSPTPTLRQEYEDAESASDADIMEEQLTETDDEDFDVPSPYQTHDQPQPVEPKNEEESIGDTAELPQQHNFNLDSLIRERNHFLALTKRNRFYDNPNYKEPWKTFSQISNKIVNDIVNVVEEDFSTGVSKFIQDFLQAETQI